MNNRLLALIATLLVLTCGFAIGYVVHGSTSSKVNPAECQAAVAYYRVKWEQAIDATEGDGPRDLVDPIIFESSDAAKHMDSVCLP
jgi:hypothetical protein